MLTELSQAPSAADPPARARAAPAGRRDGGAALRADPRSDDAALRQGVERALRPGMSLLRLSPELEARYAAETWRGRSLGIRKWLLAVATIDLMWIGIDAAVIPDHIFASLVTRGLLITGICITFARLLRSRRAPWVLGLAVAVPTLALVLITGYLAGLAGGVHAERYNTAALFASFAATIVNAIDFRYTVAVAVASLALFLVFVLTQAGGPMVESIELIASYPIAYLASLEARRLYERTHRRNFLLALRDELRVKELAAANDGLTRLSQTDPLTGVYNRRHFDASYVLAWEKAAGGAARLAVMMIDVDHFKALNDTAGHAEGDRCLQRIATAIQTHVRVEVDLVARYGGEEFVVILPDADLETALVIGEQVRAAVEGLRLPNPGLGGETVVTVSVGLAAVPAGDAACSPEALLQAADVALYAAKATGRNYVCGSREGGAALVSVADAPALAGIGAAF